MSSFLGPDTPDERCTVGSISRKIRTPKRRELLEWLKREAPSLAPAYEGAIALLYSPQFPGKVHFVSHVVRDIYNRLPGVLDGAIKRVSPGEAYPRLVGKICEKWPSKLVSFLLSAVVQESPGIDDNSVPIPRSAYDAVDELLDEYRKITNQPTTGEHLSRVLFRINPEDDVEIPRRLITAFNRERKWFTDLAHLQAKVGALPSDDDLIQHFETFEGALYSFVGSYFSGTRELDDILREANRTTG